MTNEHQLVSKKEETMNAQRIEGAVALVTGANRGIGPTVRVLAEGLGTADRRNDRCDAVGLRGVNQ